MPSPTRLAKVSCVPNASAICAQSASPTPLPPDVPTFGDSANELIVATPSDDAFVRVIYNGTDVIDHDMGT